MLTVTQYTGCILANTRPHQLCWGDRECGYYTSCTCTPGVHCEMSIFEKEGGGGGSPVYMCISTCTLGGSGGMLPQEILDLRLPVTASGAFCYIYTAHNSHA